MQTNNILVHYPLGAGGKFFICALSLANNAVLPDPILASQYLNKDLQVDDKFKIFETSVSYVDNFWNDFLIYPAYYALGSSMNQYRYTDKLLNFIDRNIDQNFNLDDLFEPDLIVRQIEKQKKFFFTPVHNIKYFYIFSNYWKNSPIVNFVNNKNFINKYRPEKNNQEKINKIYYLISDIKNSYNKIKGDSWPKFNFILKNFNNIPSEIRDELKNISPILFDNIKNMYYYIEFYQNLQSNNLSNKIYSWNTEWLFDKKDTVENIENFYDNLQLTSYSKHYVGKLYDLWIKTIDRVKTQPEHKTYNKDELTKLIKKSKSIGAWKEASYYLTELEKLLETEKNQ